MCCTHPSAVIVKWCAFHDHSFSFAIQGKRARNKNVQSSVILLQKKYLQFFLRVVHFEQNCVIQEYYLTVFNSPCLKVISFVRLSRMGLVDKVMSNHEPI